MPLLVPSSYFPNFAGFSLSQLISFLVLLRPSRQMIGELLTLFVKFPPFLLAM